MVKVTLFKFAYHGSMRLEEQSDLSRVNCCVPNFDNVVCTYPRQVP